MRGLRYDAQIPGRGGMIVSAEVHGDEVTWLGYDPDAPADEREWRETWALDDPRIPDLMDWRPPPQRR